MNSRGLDLTPFENFKASLIRYMKKQGGDFIKDVDYESALGVKTKMPYYLRFSTKMDTSWNAADKILWQDMSAGQPRQSKKNSGQPEEASCSSMKRTRSPMAGRRTLVRRQSIRSSSVWRTTATGSW